MFAWKKHRSSVQYRGFSVYYKKSLPTNLVENGLLIPIDSADRNQRFGKLAVEPLVSALFIRSAWILPFASLAQIIVNLYIFWMLQKEGNFRKIVSKGSDFFMLEKVASSLLNTFRRQRPSKSFTDGNDKIIQVLSCLYFEE